MHELRKDPVLARWVAVLANSLRPEDYPEPAKAPREEPCVLCSGNEAGTPPEIAAIRAGGAEADSPGWQARVIPSFSPVFTPEGDLGRRGYGLYDAMNSIGKNEIIAEAPGHETPEDMGPEQVRGVVGLYRQRLRDIQSDERIKYVLICKNSGPAAGASFSHPHSEIIAMPVIPHRIKNKLEGAKEYYNYKERCIFCDIMDEELRAGTRIVSETERYLLFCPYASKLPFEYWIMPKTHRCAFEDTDDAELDDLSRVIVSSIRKMREVLREPSYNMILHTAPNRVPRRDHWHTLGDDFHWHLEVVPRLRRTPGSQWGSGFYVLATSPEDAARHYRGGE